MRLEMMKLLAACRYAQRPPELCIAVTKLDAARGEITEMYRDGQTLLNYIYSAYPCVEELAPFFSGVRAFAVSAAVPAYGGCDLTGEMYAGIFG